MVNETLTERQNEAIAEMKRRWETETVIGNMPKELSLYAKDYAFPTKEDIEKAIDKLRQFKTKKSDEAYAMIGVAVLERCMTKQRFLDAVDNLIFKSKYADFQPSELFDYDSTVPLYKYEDLVGEKTKTELAGLTFDRIRYCGWGSLWIEHKWAVCLEVRGSASVVVRSWYEQQQTNRQSSVGEFDQTAPLMETAMRNNEEVALRCLAEFNTAVHMNFKNWTEVAEYRQADRAAWDKFMKPTLERLAESQKRRCNIQ